MKKIISLFLGTLLLTVFSVTGANAKTLKCQTVINAKADEVVMLKDFGQTVTDLTGGSIKFEILPAGTVVGVKETLDAVGMDPGVVKENITTSGLDLSSLRPGDVIELGNEVRLQITEPCEPCSRLDEVRDGLQAELAGRRGMLATIITGGIASTDDRIQVSDSELLPSE